MSSPMSISSPRSETSPMPISSPMSETSETSERSKTPEPPLRFPPIPAEIRQMIFRELAGPRFVRFLPSTGSEDVDEIIALRETNYETRSLVANTHRARFHDWLGNVHFMDIDNDTFRTYDMRFPATMRTRAWPFLGMSDMALPIKRLLSVHDCPECHGFVDYLPEQVRVQPPYFLGLDRWVFPIIEEFTMVFTSSSPAWWVPGFQEYGPHVINLPDEDVSDWMREKEDYRLALESGAHFEKHGIREHTGRRWPTPCQGNNFTCDHDGQRHGSFAWAAGRDNFFSPERPFIGLRGYSRNATSIGGQWAGFRYNEDTKAVFFSPLSWDEVKGVMYEGTVDNMTDFFQFPQLIVRVWVIREGLVPYDAPHHHWVQVRPVAMGESEMNKAMRVLWKQTEYLFNNTRIQTACRMRVD